MLDIGNCLLHPSFLGGDGKRGVWPYRELIHLFSSPPVPRCRRTYEATSAVFTIYLHPFAPNYSLWKSGWERVVQTEMGLLGACAITRQLLLIPDTLKTSMSMGVPAPGHCPGFLSPWCTQALPTPF